MIMITYVWGISPKLSSGAACRQAPVVFCSAARCCRLAVFTKAVNEPPQSKVSQCCWHFHTHLQFLRIFANQRGLLGPSPRTLRFREHSLTALIDTHFPQSRVTWCQAAQCRHCYSRGLKRKMAAHKSLNTPISWPGAGKRVFVFLQGLGAGKCAKLLIRGSSQYQGRL